MARNTIMAKANSGERTPDPRSQITQIVEERVRATVARELELTSLRVLRWEEEDPSSRYRLRFRELDGVFLGRRREKVLLEVKASLSRSSVKKGLSQLSETLSIARLSAPQAIGLLVFADTGRFNNLFGERTADLDELIKTESLLAWEPMAAALMADRINVTVVAESVLGEWLESQSPSGGCPVAC